jgi:hypothetical protein
MSIRRIKQRMHGEYVPRSICSTGAEVAAAAAIPELGLIATPALAGSAIAAGIPASMLAANFVPAAAGAAGLFGELGLSPASLGLQAAGYGMRALAGQDAADRRKRIADAMGQYQTGVAKQSTDLTEKYVEGATPEARAAALAGAQSEARTGYEKTIGAAGAPDRPVAGKVSDQYSQGQAASADAISQRTKALIENLSKIRAPGIARSTEARRFGRAAGEVGALNSASENVGRASMTDLGNVQESPWLNLGGDVLGAAGQGLALRNALRAARGGL